MPSPKCNFFSILEHILHGIITTSILIESGECLYTILCIVFVAKRTLYVIGKWKHKRSIKFFLFFGQVHSHNNEGKLKVKGTISKPGYKTLRRPQFFIRRDKSDKEVQFHFGTLK